MQQTVFLSWDCFPCLLARCLIIFENHRFSSKSVHQCRRTSRNLSPGPVTLPRLLHEYIVSEKKPDRLSDLSTSSTCLRKFPIIFSIIKNARKNQKGSRWNTLRSLIKNRLDKCLLNRLRRTTRSSRFLNAECLKRTQNCHSCVNDLRSFLLGAQ